MKAMAFISILLVFACHTSGKEKTYSATTPADALVKTFLGIPLKDSVDYIQWKIMLRDHDYTLRCSYQIVNNHTDPLKNNRNVEVKGKLSNDKNYYTLHHQNRILKLTAINENLLHILQPDNSLLVGNGGWSYTINTLTPTVSAGISMKAKPTVIKDSMVFVGRSPCGVPGIIPDWGICYKLKWKIVFYGNPAKNQPTTCVVYGTPYRKEGGKRGTWKMLTGANGRIHYQVNDESGKPYLYFEKADDNILLFTDADGKLLTGDNEFSFTLNRNL